MSTPTIPMLPHHLGGDVSESNVPSWNSKVANAILAQGSSPRHLLGLIQSEHPAPIAVSHYCMQEGHQEEEEPLPLFLPGTFTETYCLEPLVAPHSKSITSCIPEEVLGIAWELLEGSGRCGESSSCSRQTCLWPRARQVVATVE